jgi:hypothetical protein
MLSKMESRLDMSNAFDSKCTWLFSKSLAPDIRHAALRIYDGTIWLALSTPTARLVNSLYTLTIVPLVYREGYDRGRIDSSLQSSPQREPFLLTKSFPASGNHTSSLAR